MDSAEERGASQEFRVPTGQDSFRDRIVRAIRHCRDQGNLQGWIGQVADAVGVSDRVVESWMYGEAIPLAPEYDKLRGFLQKRFCDKMDEPYGTVTFRKESAEAATAALGLLSIKLPQQLRAIAQEIEEASK